MAADEKNFVLSGVGWEVVDWWAFDYRNSRPLSVTPLSPTPEYWESPNLPFKLQSTGGRLSDTLNRYAF